MGRLMRLEGLIQAAYGRLGDCIMEIRRQTPRPDGGDEADTALRIAKIARSVAQNLTADLNGILAEVQIELGMELNPD